MKVNGAVVIFDLYMIVLIAVSALVLKVLRVLGFPMAPLLLGFILERMLEDNLRRALATRDGRWLFWLKGR
ncbi:MAG: hypothetical protein ACNYPE_03985 [Candidatus Azotimanducaceae bacterium WSBS_2022_MAG_OTU7]